MAIVETVTIAVDSKADAEVTMALRGVGHGMSGVSRRVTFLVLGSPLKALVSCSFEKQHFVDKGHNTHARTHGKELGRSGLHVPPLG